MIGTVNYNLTNGWMLSEIQRGWEGIKVWLYSQVEDAKVNIFIHICIKACIMKLQLYLPFTTADKIRLPGSGQQQHPNNYRVKTYSIFSPQWESPGPSSISKNRICKHLSKWIFLMCSVILYKDSLTCQD